MSATHARKPKKNKDEGLWLTSFCDLSLILMSFFALMVSMAAPNQKKFEETVDSMKVNQAMKEAAKLSNIERKIREEIKKRKLEDAVTVVTDAAGVSVEFKDQLLYDSGAATMKSVNMATIGEILRLVATSDAKYGIVLEGHTDDAALAPGSRFQSNWDLSSARGISLLNLLQSKGVPQSRMRVVAFADTKPRIPVSGKSGADLQKARAANRRVVIRLE